MPYDPGITYTGGQSIAQGISSFGSSIGSAISEANAEAKKAKEEQATNDMIINHVIATQDPSAPLITPEQQSQYWNGSATQKNGIVAGLARGFAMDIQKQKIDKQNMLAQAQANEANAKAQQLWNMPFGQGGGSDEAVKSDPLIINGKEIPGIAVNRKTGQFVYYGGMQGGGIQVETDPQTGIPFYRDAKGAPHPLTGQQIMAGQMNKPMPTPTSGPGWLQRTFGIGGNPSPTPAPVPGVTPAPAAAPQGNQPQVGDKRTINGVPAVWDGNGWLAAQ